MKMALELMLSTEMANAKAFSHPWRKFTRIQELEVVSQVFRQLDLRLFHYSRLDGYEKEKVQTEGLVFGMGEQQQEATMGNSKTGCLVVISSGLPEASDLGDCCLQFMGQTDMALPPRVQRHRYLRFEGLGYTDVNITDFEERLAPSYTSIRDPMLRLYHRLIACNIVGRSQEPEKVTVTDLFYLRGRDVGSFNIPYLLARYLRMFASRRKREVMISGRQFVACLAEHFDEGAQAVPAPIQAPQPSSAAGPARTMAQR
ncbi:hypothetical protein Tco_1132742 [Tanacetum coccineum]|uniref:Uncharacterized protein n=1 Tax=Tanacetum coccineum TaxID=301880 RepID=A0ABQ5JCT5_9ASTR